MMFGVTKQKDNEEVRIIITYEKELTITYGSPKLKRYVALSERGPKEQYASNRAVGEYSRVSEKESRDSLFPSWDSFF